MTFTVTYRCTDGALREESLEAASRAECFAQCKEHGIAPISVKEGTSLGQRASRPLRGKVSAPATGAPVGNGSSGDKPQSSIFNLKSSILGVVVLLVAALGGAWWFLSRPQAKPPTDPPKNAKPVRAEKPKPQSKPEATSATNITTKQAAHVALPPWDEAFMTNRGMRLKYSTLIKATTNDGGIVVERYRLPNGKTWRKIVEPPPLFSNVSDQTIAMVMSNMAGGQIPPVPGLSSADLDKEFANSLAIPIHVEPDDSPRVAALKMAVKEVRDEIARLKGEGDSRTVGQILSEHISANNRKVNLQADALAAVKQVRQEQGEAAAEEYLKAVNDHLKSYGVKPIRLGAPRRKEKK